MTRIRAKLLCALTACATSLVHCGCTSTWHVTPVKQANPAASIVPATMSANSDATPVGDSEPNLIDVLDKLQQVRAIDPAAEQTLIDELRQTPAESWPLVAEQFRASLAYREVLAAKKSHPSQATELVDTAANSAPVGTLLDPRGAQTDEMATRERARAMHDAMQPPFDNAHAPADFAADGPAYPIAAQVSNAAAELPADGAPTAQLAKFETSDAAPLKSEYATNLRPIPSGAPPAAEPDIGWQQLLQRAADDLSRRAVPSPASTAEVHQHVSLRLMRLLAGDTESALEPIPHISAVEQDYWSRQLFALATYLDHHSQPDDKRRAAASVTHLDEAVSHLRELGSLSLRNLSFCKSVYGYGAIEAYESDKFAPAEEVSLYVEVENYHSQSTEKGFCTLLGSSYEILDEQGKRVSGGEFPEVDDCCRSRRRDFHIQYGLALPKNLTPGRYRLQLIVKDRQSDKLGQASVAFEVRGTL